MAQPKRKHSKQRSRKRRGANCYKISEFARDYNDNSLFFKHRVHPLSGMYRGRQVVEIKK